MSHNDNKIPSIQYDRMVEIATQVIHGLIEDDEYEALLYLHDTVELTEEEANFFGVDFSSLDSDEE